MKQLFLMVNDGSVKLIESPVPKCKSGYLLVETIYSVVSAGTERSLASFGSKNLLQKAKERPDQIKKIFEKVSSDGLISTVEAAFNKLSEPMPIGYSAVGRVIEVGSGISDIKPGDIVAMAGQAYHSEVNCVNRNLIVKLPENFPDIKQAAFIALGSIAMQGIRQAKIEPGETIAVIGLGLLGHITSQILNAYGCDVIAFDISESKRMNSEYIRSFVNSNDPNAENIVHSLTRGFGVDKVIITASANSNQPMDLAASIVRDRGIICMVGVTQMNIDRRPYYEKEITFTIARSYGPGRYDPNYEERGVDYPIGQVRWTENRNMAEFIRLINSRRINLAPLITHEVPFENAADAYEMITTNSKGEHYVGILLKYREYPEKFAVRVDSASPLKIRTDKKKIGVGMIGAGNFARATLLPMMDKTGKFEFIGLATTGGPNAAQAISKVPFKYITTDYTELFKNENIDLIIVTTRHDTHADFVIKALEAGKHVYVEKPLALTLEQLEHVKDIYEKSNCCLFVGFNRRYSSFIEKIRKDLKTNSFPSIYQYTVNAGFIKENHWVHDELAGGGRIIGEACHFVDTLQYLSGSGIADLNILWHDDPNGAYSKADNVSINISFKNGSIGNIIYTSMGSKAYQKENLRVFVNGSVAELKNFLSMDIYDSGKKSNFKLKQDKGFIDEYKHIYDVITGKAQRDDLQDIWDNHKFLIEAVKRKKGSL